jgi:hypothetical protein
MSRIAALLALLLAVFGLAACGSDDAPAPGGPDAVARAAATTAKAGTAATRITVEARGFGLPKPLALTGSGVTALDSSELDVTFDLDPVVQLLATQAPAAAPRGSVPTRARWPRPSARTPGPSPPPSASTRPASSTPWPRRAP